MTVEEAVAAVHSSGGLPPVRDTSYTLTDQGFLVQLSMTHQGAELHNCIIVQVCDGMAVSAEGYVGIETDLQS